MSARVFLGNLPPDVTVRDIEDFFDRYGRVRNVLLKHGKYGFAEFESSRDAEDAVDDMHGKRLLGSRIVCELAKGTRGGGEGRRAPWVNKYGAPTRTRYGLNVENISSRLSWQDIKDTFRKAGDVTFAECHTTTTGKGRVECASREDVRRIYKKFQGHEMNGRKLELTKDCSDDSRSRSRSRSRRRSSSRSKRRSRTRSRSKRRSRSYSRRSRSKSKSRSRSKSRRSRSQSGSKSPRRSLEKEDMEKDKSVVKEDKEDFKEEERDEIVNDDRDSKAGSRSPKKDDREDRDSDPDQ